MALHPKRFATTTIAEMRGYQDERGICPFWEAIGAHFFKVDFPQADALSTINKKFIEDLIPQYPIYLELLPHDAIEAIGKVHPQTAPALAMLESQGFRRNDLIDIFDAGPVVACETSKIATISQSRTMDWTRSAESRDPSSRQRVSAIVARTNRPFIAVQTELKLDPAERIDVGLDSATADALRLTPNEKVIAYGAGLSERDNRS
jgi:arginine N-succinyltransferase